MEDVDYIYLAEADLDAIEGKEIEDPKYAVVRDLLLVGCETGLRYADYVRIQPHDFMREELHIVPKKTKKLGVKKVIIPLSERFKRIIIKHDCVLPNPGKDHRTNFNKIIREICESLFLKFLKLDAELTAPKYKGYF